MSRYCSTVNALATSPSDFDEELMFNHIPSSPASLVPPSSPGPASSIKAAQVGHVLLYMDGGHGRSEVSNTYHLFSWVGSNHTSFIKVF